MSIMKVSASGVNSMSKSKLKIISGEGQEIIIKGKGLGKISHSKWNILSASNLSVIGDISNLSKSKLKTIKNSDPEVLGGDLANLSRTKLQLIS